MYSFTRGDDECSSLVPRTSTSAPTNSGLYQNEEEELFLKYGAIETAELPRSSSGDNSNKHTNFLNL